MSNSPASLLAEHGIKDEKVVNRLKPCPGIAQESRGTPASRTSASNPAGLPRSSCHDPDRASSIAARAGPQGAQSGATADDQDLAQKIKNRANELKGASPKRSVRRLLEPGRSEIKKAENMAAKAEIEANAPSTITINE